MTSESLKCLLTQDEKLKLGDKVAQTVQRMRSKEDALQEVSSQIKAEIKACQAEMNADTTKLANGYEYRSVDCRVYYHSPGKGWKRVVRLDTYEEVRVDKMGEREMQQNLFEEVTREPEQPQPAPVHEPAISEVGLEAVEHTDLPADNVDIPEPQPEDPVVPEGYEPEPEQMPPASTRRRRS